MKTMLDILTVPKCICCFDILPRGSSDMPFCPLCMTKWEQSVKECRIAAHGQPVRVYESGDSSGEQVSVLYIVKYVPGEKYRVENTLILKLKDDYRRRIVRFAADSMVSIIKNEAPFLFDKNNPEGTVVTYIPRRRLSLWYHGFDHMQKVAKEVSRLTSFPCESLITRKLFSYEQKTLTYRERTANAVKSMRISHKANVKGKTVILVDDIITSGASMDAASRLFNKAGASQVICIALAATERTEDSSSDVRDVFNIIKKPRGGFFKKAGKQKANTPQKKAQKRKNYI